MQVGILEDILEIIPREDSPKKNLGGDGASERAFEIAFKNALRDRSFRFKLNRDTYERIFKYLVDKKAVLRFQWCLERFRYEATMYPVIENYIKDKLKNENDQNPIARRGYLDCLARTHKQQNSKDSQIKFYETSLKMLSPNAFELFQRMTVPEAQQPKEKVQSQIFQDFATLLEIDAMRTIQYLFDRVEVPDQKRALIEKSIANLKQATDGEAEMKYDARDEAQQRREKQLLAFFNALFEFDANLIDEQYLTKQFQLYVKYDADKLMHFMRKKKGGTQRTSQVFYPADADEQCEKAGLYVEKAFILIDK